ncbi:hypothetical protein WQ54_18610 [Bacillus sp. SA1-12]|uniref:hypothetical protein n=1 Tax=Bacillus sp. SA1-12 TaxID=1455638 RepID=UPI000626FBA9|nr:hypothetical protein [Bacillus sp. SA1-12]KKI90764.1 hypothetical protein WQ54_18610 [Bacillus sp. SA1-12]
MEIVKYVSMLMAIFTQFTGIIFLFFNIRLAIGLFCVYFFSLLVLLALFIKTRLDEKKEDAQHDYCDY